MLQSIGDIPHNVYYVSAANVNSVPFITEITIKMKGEVNVDDPNLNVPPRLFDLKTSIKDCGGNLLLCFVNESSCSMYQKIALLNHWRI